MPAQDSPWKIVSPVQLDINDFPSYHAWLDAQTRENERVRIRNMRVANYGQHITLYDMFLQTGISTQRIREYLGEDLAIRGTPPLPGQTI